MPAAKRALQHLRDKLQHHLEALYPQIDREALGERLLQAMGIEQGGGVPRAHANLWNQSDVLMITYGDTFISADRPPLQNLHHFLTTYLQGTVSGVHILPFFPYSSDDGFAVINYYQVNEALGDWQHIHAIAKRFDVMADVVINHCSSRSGWFDNFKQRKDPGKDYFIEADPADDLSHVVRPRTTPLLREVQTLDGKRHVWCTFSHDQVDLDFSNPEVLLQFVDIIRFYLDNHIRIFRLDAVAFLWKKADTPCIHLRETHEIIRLLRLLISHREPKAIVITETNVPNRENLTYFGNANEAHAIYNFALPPLLIHTLVTGSCRHLKSWLMSLPPAQNGTAYLNFIASHDGIGLRPVEGMLSDGELDQLIDTMRDFGGLISWRSLEGGMAKAYEVNISLYEAMAGTVNGRDVWQQQRFLCAHAIMLAIEGIPAIYVHSLLATLNDHEKMQLTNQNRSINRHRWDYAELQAKLRDPESHHARVFAAMQRLIGIRRRQPAFHPNATQYTLHLGDHLFAFWRQSPDRRQSIFAIHNVSDESQGLALTELNLIEQDQWHDLISGQRFDDLHQRLELAPYQCLWLTNLAPE